jgi:type 1 fimbriae regulatory protein FimB/type 1 fimbriae regulatory protein FimE
MKNSPIRLIAPTVEMRTVAMPVRKPNAELRTREYLTTAEVDRLIELCTTLSATPTARVTG